MKKYISVSSVICTILFFSCTKEVEKIIYPNGNPDSTTGSIVGLVVQKNSNAKIVVRQATPIDSTIIDPIDGSFRMSGLPVGNYDIYVKAENYGTYWIRNVLVNPGGVTYVGEISLSEVPDFVESYYPQDESEIVFNRRWSRLSISMSFTKEMDRVSVEQALSIDPPSDGVFYWGMYTYAPTPNYFWDESGDYSSKEGTGAEITTYSKIRSFTFRMARKDCYTDTTYTVTLSTAARDTAGNNLEFPLVFRFSTIQSAYTQNVILTQPEHGDIFVDPLGNTSIHITFPRRMNQSSVEENLTITPATDVIFVWPGGNQLRIYTGGPLNCETLYEIHIDSTAQDLDGVELGEPFDFSFETSPVEIEYTRPQNGEIFVSRNKKYSKISIVFNTYMILSSVQSAFTIEPELSGSMVRGWGSNESNPQKDVITFVPYSNLAANTKYTVTIGTGAYDLHGTNLKDAYTFAFVTEPE